MMAHAVDNTFSLSVRSLSGTSGKTNIEQKNKIHRLSVASQKADRLDIGLELGKQDAFFDFFFFFFPAVLFSFPFGHKVPSRTSQVEV